MPLLNSFNYNCCDVVVRFRHLNKELLEGRYVEETVRNALALLQGGRRVYISDKGADSRDRIGFALGYPEGFSWVQGVET